MKVPGLVKKIFGIGLVVALLCLVDTKELLRAIALLDLQAILLLLALSVALIAVSALKWKRFIESMSDVERGTAPSLLRLFNLYLVGYFVNLVLPSYLGGDVVRSVYAGRAIGQHAAFAATILERFTGLAAMLILALSFLSWAPAVTTQMVWAVVIIACGIAGVAVMALSPRILKLARRIPRAEGVLRHLEKLQGSIRSLRSPGKILAETMAWSLVFHTLTVLNTLVAAQGVGWSDAPPRDLFVVLPLILLLGALPVAPQGLGIQEGAFYFFLSALGATPAQALGVALVLRAKSYVLAAVGGIVWLVNRSGGAANVAPQVSAPKIEAVRGPFGEH